MPRGTIPQAHAGHGLHQGHPDPAATGRDEEEGDQPRRVPGQEGEDVSENE